MNWSGKKALVTGSGGFIGSHLTESLVEAGAAVRALVHYNALGKCGWLDHSPYRKHVEVILGDITDAGSVRQVVKGQEFVFHLAALIGIPYSYQAPASYVRTNIDGSLNVLEAAREFGVERVVHTSTSEVYGTALKVPIAEDHPLQGQSPYSATKIAADKLAEAYYRSFNVPVVTVRPFNTFGPRQSTRAVIPTIITQCLGQGVVRLGNLNATRDLNYVSNTVDGFMLAASSSSVLGHTINVGSGAEIRIGELVNLIAKLTGRSVAIVTDENRLRPEKSEVERLLADNSLARQLLAWQPSVDLKEGLRRTIAWFADNLEGYRGHGYTV